MAEAGSFVNIRPLTLNSINSIKNLDPPTRDHLLTTKSFFTSKVMIHIQGKNSEEPMCFGVGEKKFILSIER